MSRKLKSASKDECPKFKQFYSFVNIQIFLLSFFPQKLSYVAELQPHFCSTFHRSKVTR